MNIELSVIITPTDQGVRVLGSCNKDYKDMIQRLDDLTDEGHLPNYTVPRARQKSQLYFADGTVDYSVLKYVTVSNDQSAMLLYRQPYSEQSLKRTVHELGRRYDTLKEYYKRERGVMIEE